MWMKVRVIKFASINESFFPLTTRTSTIVPTGEGKKGTKIIWDPLFFYDGLSDSSPD